MTTIHPVVARIPSDEKLRLAKLGELRVLDTLPESEFDDLVQAVAALMDMPIAYVSFVDEERQWLKAKSGIDVCETHRDVAFCAHAILRPDPLVVPDTWLDPRFVGNPLVRGELGIRFYAGAPIVVDGLAVGTLCCMDIEPRQPTVRQVEAMAALGRQAATLLRARLHGERLAQSERRFEAFISSAPGAAFLKDGEGRFRYVSQGFEPMFGMADEAVIGKTVFDLFPHAVAAGMSTDDETARRTGRTLAIDESAPDAAGEMRHLQTFKFPFETEDGAWIGGIAYDVTDLREAEATVAAQRVELERALAAAEASAAALAMAATRFEQLFTGLPVACYTFDLEGRVQEWNGAAEALFGIPCHEAFLSAVDRTVADRDGGAVMASARRVLDGESVVDEETLVTRLDGSQRWLLTNSFPIRNAGGAIVGGMSAHVDVTDRKRGEDALREKEERFRTVVDSLHEGVAVQDAGGTIRLWNPSAARLFSMEIEGRNVHQERQEGWRLLRPDGESLASEEHPTAQVFRDGKSRMATIVGIEFPNGDVRWLTVNSIPLALSEAGTPAEVVSSFVDITERLKQERFIEDQMVQISGYSSELEIQKLDLEEANRRLEDLATTDGLTGLKNHRTFQDFLRRKIDHCANAGLPLSIALLDVDRFKGYNDDFGHQAGDAVLQGVAEVLSQSVRESEMVARYGGEEFVIVMPGLNGDHAVALAERVRARLAETPFDLRAVTASFGVASLGPALGDAASLVKAADEALYASKAAGRDRVTLWREPSSVPA